MGNFKNKSEPNNSALNICLENIESVAYILDKDGNITNCNNEFLQSINLKKEMVMGRKITQLDFSSSEIMHQNNMMVMVSGVDCSYVLEFIKTKINESLPLFKSQKKVIRDGNGETVGLLSVSKKHLPNQAYDVASFQIKHQLREALNAMYGYNQRLAHMVDISDAKLALDFEGIIDKLSEVVEKIPVARVENFMSKENQHHWCKVLWISDSIASFVFQSDADGLVVDKIDLKAALNAMEKRKISSREYQIILIDESLLDLLPWDFQVIAESALIIQVGESHFHKHRNFHTSNISHNRLLLDYQTYLPKMWQNYVRIKTVQKVNNNARLRVLSIEDNHDSQNVLKQLLALYEFIEVEVCQNAEQARHMVSEHPFDLIVLDLGLPDSPSDSGYDFALSIRGIQQQKGDFLCPIIINTGHESMPGVETLFRCGVNAFYRKPDLVKNLDSILADYVPKSIRYFYEFSPNVNY